jgi:AcrR family transcriptional regulator
MKKKTATQTAAKTDTTTTEEKIKQAARQLFTSNGFTAVTIRDIAKEAGCNVALLNYYFRSKDKLFEIIMLENLAHFVSGVATVLSDESTSLEQKFEKIVAIYIDKLTREPELILFIVNEIRANPDILLKKLGIEAIIRKSHFRKQILSSGYLERMKSVNPLHFGINIVGLTITPFLMAPMMKKIMKCDQQQFESLFKALMEERKALIPQWIGGMMQKGTGNK